jgi:hypothetical protein
VIVKLIGLFKDAEEAEQQRKCFTEGRAKRSPSSERGNRRSPDGGER